MKENSPGLDCGDQSRSGSKVRADYCIPLPSTASTALQGGAKIYRQNIFIIISQLNLNLINYWRCGNFRLIKALERLGPLYTKLS